MNVYSTALFALLILSVEIQNSLCVRKPEIRHRIRFNFYKENTKQLHIVMNKLFMALKLNKNFTQQVKIRMLLRTHSRLLNIVHNKYEINDGGKAIDNITINDFANLNLLERILGYKTLLFSESATKQNYINNLSVNVTGYLRHLISVLDTLQVSRNNTLTKTNRRRRKQPQSINPETWQITRSNENIANLNRRIYRSKKAMIGNYPFMASVHMMNEFVCAGSIISKGLVITAASCLQLAYIHRNNNSPSNISVRIGSKYTNQGVVINVSYVHFHPLYDPETLKQNLAILELERQIRLSNATGIRRIVYDKLSKVFPEDVNGVLVLGWGITDDKNRQVAKQTLTQAYLELYDTDDCAAVYSKHYVYDSNFCAGFVQIGSGVCGKDLGDPAIISEVLVGIVSFGPPRCGTPDTPTVFTRLGIYASWIDSIVELARYSQVLDSNRVTGKKKFKSKKMGRTATRKINSPLRKDSNGPINYNNDHREEVVILNEILKGIMKKKDDPNKDERFNRELADFVAYSNELEVMHSLHQPRTVKATQSWNFEAMEIDVGFMPPINTPNNNPDPGTTETTSHSSKRIHHDSEISRISPKLTEPIFGYYEDEDTYENFYESKPKYHKGLSIEISAKSNLDKKKTTHTIYSKESNSRQMNGKKTTKIARVGVDDYNHILFDLEGHFDIKGPKPKSRQGNPNQFSARYAVTDYEKK